MPQGDNHHSLRTPRRPDASQISLIYLSKQHHRGALSCKHRQQWSMDEETEGEGLTHQGGVWFQCPLLFHCILWGQASQGRPWGHLLLFLSPQSQDQAAPTGGSGGIARPPGGHVRQGSGPTAVTTLQTCLWVGEALVCMGNRVEFQPQFCLEPDCVPLESHLTPLNLNFSDCPVS